MIDWIYEINWLMIIMVTIGVFFGTEFGRRRQEGKGEIYSFLPLQTHRLHGVAAAVSAGLFIESAKVAVKMPTTFHVWMLLFIVAAAFIVCLAFTGLEFKLAKRALKEAGHKQNKE